MNNKSDTSTLTVPNDLSYSAVVGSYVKAVSRKTGFNEDDLQMIELGVDEAFTNVVEHAFDPDEDATFKIICTRIPLGLKIAIREKGMPFDPTKIPEYDPTTPLEEQSGEGLGFYLMKQSMDEVQFNNLGKQGKETCLIKYLSKKSIEEMLGASELKRFEKPFEKKEKQKEKKIELFVRRMKAEEAVEVSKCIYRTYGYSYDKEHAYFPERMAELNKKGIIISTVAVTKDGEMAGHSALIKENVNDKIAEFGMAVTKPKFRGQGCMYMLGAYDMELSRKGGLTGVFGQAVSNHPFSQKGLHKFGFKDCGILLGSVPTTRSFKGINDELTQRESYVISFQYLNEPSNLQVHAPPHHKEMLEKIYSNIEIKPEFVDDDDNDYDDEDGNI